MPISDTKWVSKIEAKSGGQSGTYWKVTWHDGKTDNLFDPDMMAVCEEAMSNKLAVQYTKEKPEGGRFWNITHVELTKELIKDTPEAPPPMGDDTGSVPRKVAPQEEGMWWKEVGEFVRSPLYDKTNSAHKTLFKVYMSKMMETLGIKITVEDK